MKATEQKVLRFIKENKLLCEGEKILAALSGGADSVFLLHFLNKYKKKFKIEIGAAHLNHLLRGKDSERDEQFCKAVCFELSVPIYVYRRNVKAYSKKNKISLEAAGRKIRYSFFEKISKEKGYNKIVTAHNADDNAETVLLNLIKGTGLKGISGIPVKRKNIVRPILSLTKKEILDYLEENKFEFRVDESNLTNDFERNFIRNEIVPGIIKNLNPNLFNSVLTTSLNLQRLNLWISGIVNDVKKDVSIKQKKSVFIPITLIKKYNEFIISYAVKEIIDENFSVKLESGDIKKLLSLIKKQAGKSEELSQNLIALKERNEIIVKEKLTHKISDIYKINVGSKMKLDGKVFSIDETHISRIKISKDKNTEYVSAEGLDKDFIIRKWKPGDKFFPLGMKGTKKISDYLNDIKMNSFEKSEQLVLENCGRIIWVIGKRLDDRFKLTPKSKKVFKLCLK